MDFRSDRNSGSGKEPRRFAIFFEDKKAEFDVMFRGVARVIDVTHFRKP